MFQPSTTASVLPIVNPSVTRNSASSYSWKTWVKAGLVFATTTGAFFALKATGSFSLISSWLKNLERSEDNTLIVRKNENFVTTKADVGVTLQGYSDDLENTHKLTDFAELPLHDFQKHQTFAFPAVIELASLDGSNGFKLDGEAVGDGSGYSVSSAGDVNGDNIADLIVGAPQASSSGRRDAGRSYVVFGHNGTWNSPFLLSSLDGSNGFKLDGEVKGDGSGFSVNSAGDINGDNIADLIVGAPIVKGGPILFPAGKSYVVFGHSGTWTSLLPLSSLDGSNGFKLDSEELHDMSGYSVSSAGDINGDNIIDLIVGAPGARSYAGRSYVVFGHNGTWNSPFLLSSLDGSNGFKLDGESVDDLSGFSVNGAGDINGDNIADLIVGAYYATPTHAGRSYVVFGHSGIWISPLELSSLDGTNGFKLNGETAGDCSGISVSGGRDINGDNIADLIIGAPNEPGVGVYGKSYVVFGHNGTWTSSIELSSLDGTNGFKLYGEMADDYSGFSVSSVGDINGDNIADLIIGAFGANGKAGRSYVVFGHSGIWTSPFELSSLDGTNGFMLDGEEANDNSGQSVSSAGDVNGDSIADLIVGAPVVRNEAGRSYVVFGQSSQSSSSSAISKLSSNPSNSSSTVSSNSASTISSTTTTSSSKQEISLSSSSSKSVQTGGGLLWLIGPIMGLAGVIACGVSGFFLKRYLDRRTYIELESTKLPFRAIRQIGRGGTAEVYEGEWEEPGPWKGKHVAIKKLPDMCTGIAEITDEFTNEANFLEEYRHPNLIEFVEFFAAPHWCLVLKYYYRGSLDKVLGDYNYVLPWNPERNRFMEGIAKGLRFLHEKGIIHRDMKPGNILIDDDMRPKITDLGTARMQDTLKMSKGVGTPAYIAPEVIKATDRKAHYDSSVDVYAFGLILWAIWKREEPFQQFGNVWEMMNYVADKQGRPSLDDCPSPSLASLMSRCWAHRPDVRPKMLQVCEELNIVTTELAFA